MTIAGAENIKNITINKEISDPELSAINSLDLTMFNDAGTGTAEDLKTVLKDAEIAIDGVDNPMKLVDIAEQFDQYVTKGDSWKLKLKDENDTATPEWIKNIVNEPKNNDLAFFIQKLAGLIAYQTATAYTETELTAAAVSIDKTFGNQTRRALIGLKSWIENEGDYKNVAEGQTYTGKYLDKSFVEGVVSTQTTDETKNIALAKYNLQYKDGEIQPKDDYEFVDPNSTNYAVVVKGLNQDVDLIDDVDRANVGTALESTDKDAYENTIMTMTNIYQLPKNDKDEYKRDEKEKKTYRINVGGVYYLFRANGRGNTSLEKSPVNSKDLVTEILKSMKAKAGTAVESTDKDAYGNTIMTMTNIYQLPKNDKDEYKRDEKEKKTYRINVGGVYYLFRANGRGNTSLEKSPVNSKDLVDKLLAGTTMTPTIADAIEENAAYKDMPEFKAAYLKAVEAKTNPFQFGNRRYVYSFTGGKESIKDYPNELYAKAMLNVSLHEQKKQTVLSNIEKAEISASAPGQYHLAGLESVTFSSEEEAKEFKVEATRIVTDFSYRKNARFQKPFGFLENSTRIGYAVGGNTSEWQRFDGKDTLLTGNVYNLEKYAGTPDEAEAICIWLNEMECRL